MYALCFEGPLHVKVLKRKAKEEESFSFSTDQVSQSPAASGYVVSKS